MEGGHQSCQNVYSVNIWLVGVTPPVFALFITKHKFKLYIKHIHCAFSDTQKIELAEFRG